MAEDRGSSPVLLLKTKSKPTDAYEDLFASRAAQGGLTFTSYFVPVMEHRFTDKGLQEVTSFLEAGQFCDRAEAKDGYGGIIFTSQRAVEAFAHVVGEKQWPLLGRIPVYSVGPATTRALRAVHQTPPLQVFGEHTGNGDKLAAYILDHYTKWYDARQSKPPLLFLVGEQRRDIIPKTLMSESIPPARRIRVDEVEVYETAVLQSFKDDFSQIMSETAGAAVRWIVVFSPIGLGAMLQNLGLWDPATETAQPATSIGGRTTFVATIGPTTASFLETHFGFKPDVCSAQPSPEALLTSISDFMAAIKRDARPPRVGKK